MTNPFHKYREQVARAMCLSNNSDPDGIAPNDGPRWRYYVPYATTALDALWNAMQAEGSVLSAESYEYQSHEFYDRIVLLIRTEPTA